MNTIHSKQELIITLLINKPQENQSRFMKESISKKFKNKETHQ